jgi:hypothetical protein
MEREHIRRGRHNVAGPAPTWWASLCVAQSACIAAEALKRGSRSSKSNPITCSGAASAGVLLVRAHLLVAYFS